MNDEYVEFTGKLCLLKSDADAYEKELAEADRGGNSRQRRDAVERVNQKYGEFHVNPHPTAIRMFADWSDPATDEERDRAITLILEHLGMKIVQVSTTRYSNVEMKLSPID